MFYKFNLKLKFFLFDIFFLVWLNLVLGFGEEVYDDDNNDR